MLLLHLTSLAVAAVVGAAPTTVPPAVQAVGADSVTDVLLTAEQMNRYIALKKDLKSYWQDTAHAALLKTARAKARQVVYQQGGAKVNVAVIDYPTLVKQDAALAAIFTKNHFPVQDFGPTYLSVTKAICTAALVANGQMEDPDSSTVLGKNVAMVNAHRPELVVIGDSPHQTKKTKSSQGSGDDLSP